MVIACPVMRIKLDRTNIRQRAIYFLCLFIDFINGRSIPHRVRVLHELHNVKTTEIDQENTGYSSKRAYVKLCCNSLLINA